jgi:6-pyruvoyltetrahydropterin/6-carboxytetrahydropterin synthase
VHTIGKRFTFEASHVLSGLPEGHQCARLHGHGYTVEVEVAADALTGPGWVTDFGDLAPFGRYLDEHFDHRHLNDVLEDQPTSENLAAHFFAWCTGHLGPVITGRVTAVRVSEKRQATWAEYRPDSR